MSLFVFYKDQLQEGKGGIIMTESGEGRREEYENKRERESNLCVEPKKKKKKMTVETTWRWACQR